MVARAKGEKKPQPLSLHIRPIAFADPLTLVPALAKDPVFAFLDSAAADPGAGDEDRGRYSYLCADPWRVITADDTTVRVDSRPVAGDPFAVLAATLAEIAEDEPVACPVPFATGLCGVLGYGLGAWLERLAPAPADRLALPAMTLGVYDCVAAFDLRARKAWIVSSGRPERDPRRRAARALARAEALERRLAAVSLVPDETAAAYEKTGSWRAERPRAAILAAIGKTIDAIEAGELFQANITQRFLADLPPGLDDLTLYRRLRRLSPAPFAALVGCGADHRLIGASPERFLRLGAEGRVETRPIKGTRRRDADPARDAAQAAALVASEKDRAENLMIVDLMRNDLGRVCAIGSVRVPRLIALESFASVHHLVSAVEGRLRPGLGAIDLLRACFPGGSVTGAPKIRAMDLITALEPARRGWYCGSVAWIGADGAMDSNIVIRSLTRAGATLIAQAGGAITAPSDPAEEYEESLIKMAPLLSALDGIER